MQIKYAMCGNYLANNFIIEIKTPKRVAIITIHPAITFTIPRKGTSRILFFNAKPTARDTITPASHIKNVRNFVRKFLFCII